VTPDSPQPFHRIAGRYRLINRVISLGLDAVWRREAIAALDVSLGLKVLDIGVGTGEMLELLPDGTVKIGIDPSREMIAGSNQPFHRMTGVGEQLPLKSASIDRVTSAFVLRNLQSRSATFREIARALKPGGLGALMDFSPGRGWFGFFANLYLRWMIPALGGLLAGDLQAYRYLSRTILAFPAPEVICDELRSAGLVEVRQRRLVGAVNVLYTFRKTDA